MLKMPFEVWTIGTVFIERQKMEASRRRVECGTLVAKEVVIIHKIQPVAIKEIAAFQFKRRKSHQSVIQMFLVKLERCKIIIDIRARQSADTFAIGEFDLRIWRC